MPPVEPPKDCAGRPRYVNLAAGTKFFRIHRWTRAATDFAPAVERSPFSGGRFDCLPGEDESCYLYAAFSERTAVAELFLRSLPFDDRGARALPQVALAARRISCLVTTRDLTLLSLRTAPDLAGVCQDEWLVHAEAGEYAKTRHWGRWLRKRASTAQGFLWSSKRDHGEQAVVLFGDRCGPSALRLCDRPPLDLDTPAGRKWLNDVLADYGVTVWPPDEPGE